MSVTHSNSSTTSFRWSIVGFESQRLEASNNEEDLTSDIFALTTALDVQFVLFFRNHPSGSWSDHTYGIALKNLGTKEHFKFDLKIWMENEDGQKFGEYSAHKQLFKDVDDECKFSADLVNDDCDLLEAIEDNDETLFICCEITELNLHIVPVVNCDNEFHQDLWSLYEREIHDAVVKVGDKEFKIIKFLFIAHSLVFERMFLSNFKEGVKNEVVIEDVDEETMQHLVKWFYTNRLENDAPIEKLFAAADKYDVKPLKSTCIQLMSNSFDSVNAFLRLILAIQHNDQVLRESALNFISRLPSYELVNFLTSNEWKELESNNAEISQEVGNSLKEKLKN